ncbi:MAG: methylenetetrahydrofolate reductase C-terminal domain-containing protein [Promethearchaeota archaeon]
MTRQYFNHCEACRPCLSNVTGKDCPIIMCPKSMLNGPCGGMQDGKCEVDSYQNPCAWVIIADRLKVLHKGHLLDEVRSPFDWNKYGVPILDVAIPQTGKNSDQYGEGEGK